MERFRTHAQGLPVSDQHKIAILNGNPNAIPIDPWHFGIKDVSGLRRLDIDVRSNVASLLGRLLT